MERKCEWCEKGFEGWAGWKANRFCSGECYHAWRRGKNRGQVADKRPPEEKVCPVCGESFTVGGRGNHGRWAKTCSVKCASKAKYNTGATARTMLPVEAAYVAGIVDGEGSIILYMRRDVVAMMLVVTNTDRELLEWLRRITGVGAVNTQTRETLVRRQSAMWRCNAEAAVTVLEQIAPYLVVKCAQCALAIETQSRLRDPATKADRVWHQEWRAKMRALNRRGPKLVPAGS